MLNCSLTHIVFMVSECPKCGRNVPDDSVYCPYCGHGLKPSARTTQVSAGGTLTIVAAVAHFIIFVESLVALFQIYNWYPPVVAVVWVAYDKVLAVFAFTGFVSGLSAGILSLTRRSYRWGIISTILCAVSGAGAWILSMIIPFANVWTSLLYYFLPMFVPALTATVMIYPRKAEFKQ